MTYIHNDQFRCAIIRGKAQSELDNLLPHYASIISDICPASKETFDSYFNTKLIKLLGDKIAKKTLNNHRTEIAYKLFGMYYIDSSNIVHISERTLKLLEDNDQPAFFKDLSLKMQFPSGMNKKTTISKQIENKINIRQLCFLIAVLKECDTFKIFLNVKQVGYYILNSKSVLTRQVNVKEVVDQIIIDLESNIIREIPNPENRESSYLYQHIKEQITILELANLVFLHDRYYKINSNEINFINYMASLALKSPDFDFYSENFDLDNFSPSWDLFISKISNNINADLLNSNVSSILTDGLLRVPNIDAKISKSISNTKDLGDAGEEFVFEYEKTLLKLSNLENKVQNKSSFRGIGFDILSFCDEEKKEKYIEVKSTRRTTPMPINFSEDVINMTRNEWIAAEKYQDLFVATQSIKNQLC